MNQIDVLFGIFFHCNHIVCYFQINYIIKKRLVAIKENS
jgi:hypothetical protein